MEEKSGLWEFSQDKDGRQTARLHGVVIRERCFSRLKASLRGLLRRPESTD